MHAQFIRITSNQYPNKFPTNCVNNHLFTPAQPSYTGQTGPPDRSDRPPLAYHDTGQTGPSDRSDRSYPYQNLETLARQKSPTNSKYLLGSSSGVRVDAFDQR